MSEIDTLDSGIAAARIGSIRVRPNYHLEVTWAEGARAGKTDIVDLSPAIESYKVYRPMRNNEPLFATAHLIDDGYAIEWSRNLDMSADLVEALTTKSLLTVNTK